MRTRPSPGRSATWLRLRRSGLKRRRWRNSVMSRRRRSRRPSRPVVVAGRGARARKSGSTQPDYAFRAARRRVAGGCSQPATAKGTDTTGRAPGGPESDANVMDALEHALEAGDAATFRGGGCRGAAGESAPVLAPFPGRCLAMLPPRGCGDILGSTSDMQAASSSASCADGRAAIWSTSPATRPPT